MDKSKTPRSFRKSQFENSRTFIRRLLSASAVVLPSVLVASGCSSDDEGPVTTTGGTASVGQTGGAASGGAASGGVASGGVASGGVASGGVASGGAASGGAETGGASAGGSDSGGAPASGGMVGAGGTESTGGTDGDDDPLSPGCEVAFTNPPPSNQQQTMEIAGDTRYYLMDVPDGADNQTPLMLVLALHGFDMNNIAVVDLFNFTQRSGGQAITVWPQGEGPPPGNVSHWGDSVLQSTWSPNEANYAFLEQIITDLGERYCIDRKRIFIAGFSMGGFFTNQIACDHSDWFRAFAPVAGGGPTCANANIQSAIMVQHGTADPIVDPTSGQDSRDFWIGQNGCSSSSMKSLNNCDFYDGCAADKPVAWCTGNYDHYIPDEAASNIWSFFSSL